jgi:hypothetical protein
VSYTVNDAPVTISGGSYVLKSDGEKIDFQSNNGQTRLNYDRTLSLAEGF